MNVRLYIWQRLTAGVLAPMILIHVAIIFYASGRGLSAADVLARTRGSIVWALFYGVFVLAAGIHASIGLRNVISEWSPLGNRATGLIAIGFGVILTLIGFRAVVAVVGQ